MKMEQMETMVLTNDVVHGSDDEDAGIKSLVLREQMEMTESLTELQVKMKQTETTVLGAAG